MLPFPRNLNKSCYIHHQNDIGLLQILNTLIYARIFDYVSPENLFKILGKLYLY